MIAEPTSWAIVAGIASVSALMSYFGASVGLVLGQFRLLLLLGYFDDRPAVAIATSLTVSALAALTGAVRHVRAGHFKPSVFLAVGAPSTIAVFYFMHSGAASAGWIKGLIGVVLVFSGIVLLGGHTPERRTVELPRRAVVPAELTIGAVFGALSGCTGLMLGSLRLPVLVRLLRLDSHVAVGTNMAIGCATGIVGAIAAMIAGILPVAVVTAIAAPTMVGAYLGAGQSARLSGDSLRRLIGATVVVVGIFMVAERLV